MNSLRQNTSGQIPLRNGLSVQELKMMTAMRMEPAEPLSRNAYPQESQQLTSKFGDHLTLDSLAMNRNIVSQSLDSLPQRGLPPPTIPGRAIDSSAALSSSLSINELKEMTRLRLARQSGAPEIISAPSAIGAGNSIMTDLNKQSLQQQQLLGMQKPMELSRSMAKFVEDTSVGELAPISTAHLGNELFRQTLANRPQPSVSRPLVSMALGSRSEKSSLSVPLGSLTQSQSQSQALQSPSSITAVPTPASRLRSNYLAPISRIATSISNVFASRAEHDQRHATEQQLEQVLSYHDSADIAQEGALHSDPFDFATDEGDYSHSSTSSQYATLSMLSTASSSSTNISDMAALKQVDESVAERFARFQQQLQEQKKLQEQKQLELQQQQQRELQALERAHEQQLLAVRGEYYLAKAASTNSGLNSLASSSRMSMHGSVSSSALSSQTPPVVVGQVSGSSAGPPPGLSSVAHKRADMTVKSAPSDMLADPAQPKPQSPFSALRQQGQGLLSEVTAVPSPRQILSPLLSTRSSADATSTPVLSSGLSDMFSSREHTGLGFDSFSAPAFGRQNMPTNQFRQATPPGTGLPYEMVESVLGSSFSPRTQGLDSNLFAASSLGHGVLLPSLETAQPVGSPSDFGYFGNNTSNVDNHSYFGGLRSSLQNDRKPHNSAESNSNPWLQRGVTGEWFDEQPLEPEADVSSSSGFFGSSALPLGSSLSALNNGNSGMMFGRALQSQYVDDEIYLRDSKIGGYSNTLLDPFSR